MQCHTLHYIFMMSNSFIGSEMTRFTAQSIIVSLLFVWSYQAKGQCLLFKDSWPLDITEPNCHTTVVNVSSCVGSCKTLKYPTGGNGRTHMDHELSCCLPTSYGTMKVLLVGFDGTNHWKSYDVILDCGCYSCNGDLA